MANLTRNFVYTSKRCRFRVLKFIHLFVGVLISLFYTGNTRWGWVRELLIYNINNLIKEFLATDDQFGVQAI